MVVMVTGPSFNNIQWRTYIGRYPEIVLPRADLHIFTSVRLAQRAHRSGRLFLLSGDFGAFVGRFEARVLPALI